MITLYHGSYIQVGKPLVKLGRKKVDFGQGFYLTKLRLQASSWAKTIAERKGRNALPTCAISSFAYDAVKRKDYGLHIRAGYNLEWLEYVVDCRKGGTKQTMYDIVEGGVANDNVIDTVEDYENNVITAEQALGQLKYKAVNHQLCILNQEIVDNYLSFISSEQIEKED